MVKGLLLMSDEIERQVVRVKGGGGGGYGEILKKRTKNQPRRSIDALLHLPSPGVTDELELLLMGKGELVRVEDEVLVGVEDDVVVGGVGRELALPLGEAQEAVADGDDGVDAVGPDGADGLLVPALHVLGRQLAHLGLVEQAVDGDDVLVAVLPEELGHAVVDLERALRIERPVRAVHPAHRPQSPAVVPPVLAPRRPVQVQVHAQPVSSRPLDRPQQISPRDLRHVRVVREGRHGPVSERDAHVVQPGRGDVGEGRLRDEFRVVALEHLGRRGRAQVLGERVLVHDAQVAAVALEQRRRDERLDVQPAADVDAPDRLRPVLPLLVEVGHPVVGPRVVVPGRVQTHDGQVAERGGCVGDVEVRRVVPRKGVENRALGLGGDVRLGYGRQVRVRRWPITASICRRVRAISAFLLPDHEHPDGYEDHQEQRHQDDGEPQLSLSRHVHASFRLVIPPRATLFERRAGHDPPLALVVLMVFPGRRSSGPCRCRAAHLAHALPLDEGRLFVQGVQSRQRVCRQRIAARSR